MILELIAPFVAYGFGILVLAAGLGFAVVKPHLLLRDIKRADAKPSEAIMAYVLLQGIPFVILPILGVFEWNARGLLLHVFWLGMFAGGISSVYVYARFRIWRFRESQELHRNLREAQGPEDGRVTR